MPLLRELRSLFKVSLQAASHEHLRLASRMFMLGYYLINFYSYLLPAP
jgi:hypothetical protein